jgi:hypothetical protein
MLSQRWRQEATGAILSYLPHHYQDSEMKYLMLASTAVLLVACSAEPGSEKWCAEKKEQPKSEWSAADAGTYAKNCLIDGMEVGSEKWCKKLAEKPKGDWTADEATSYAKHCVL